MLDTHRIDLRIHKALDRLKHGGTIHEIHRTMTEPVSPQAIMRHLEGLVELQSVSRSTGERNGRPVFIFHKSAERLSKTQSDKLIS